MSVTLVVQKGGERVLQIGSNENALLPLEAGERQAVFVVLIQALAILAGLNPGCLCAAKATEMDLSSVEI